MKTAITETREIEIKEEYDVIVAGGGVAGIAGALAARRRGMKVLLIEKSSVLGGLSTLGLVNWYEPLCNGEGKVITTGIAEELLILSIKYGYGNLHNQWKSAKETVENPRRRYATLFNPAIFSLALNELVINEGIDLRYDMIASYAYMESNICRGVIVESKNGREYFGCKQLIDATGDADLAFRAGVPCRDGQNYMTYYGHGCTMDSIKRTLITEDMVNLNANKFHVGSDLDGNGHPEGMPMFVGVSNEIITNYIKTGQQMLLEKLKSTDTSLQCLNALPQMAQLRKTRCIIGDDVFSGEAFKYEEKSIGAVGDFRKRGLCYEIPVTALYNSNFPNIIAAGRIISAKGDGWEISRVIPTAAMTGEAAGVLAAISINTRTVVSEVSIGLIQAELIKNKVTIHF